MDKHGEGWVYLERVGWVGAERGGWRGGVSEWRGVGEREGIRQEFPMLW